MTSSPAPVALITGAAVRLGEATARLLHSGGYNIVIHCNRSLDAGNELAASLNAQRTGSAVVIQAELGETDAVIRLGEEAISAWDRLDVLINNASAFYPTPLESLSESDWQNLFASNAKGPLFLCHSVASALKNNRGCIINISDLYAGRGLRKHSIYTMAKAALEGMTRTLARELAPEVRVNAIAPGAILWPSGDNTLSEEAQQAIIEKSFLKRIGAPADIANAILFLVEKGTYITGQVLHVDGGR